MPALLLAALLALAGCAASPEEMVYGPAAAPAATDRDVELFVQRRLVDARTFREQGRLEAAQRALERALAVAPDDAAAHRLLGRVLEEQGRRGEALAHYARADELDPPPPPPPDAPLALETHGLVIVLVEPDGAAAGPDEEARRPDPEIEASVLEKRLAARLPGALVLRADPASVAAGRELLRKQGARAALSLRTERGFCAYSRKDGDFGVAWLRVAGATPKQLVVPPTTVREVVSDPPSGDACLRLALARALERAFHETDAMRTVREASSGGGWSSDSVRALFPGLARRVTQEIERGRARLATGRVGAAAEAFRAALAVDPEDADARAYLREAEDTLAIARALGTDQPAETGELEFSLSPAERAIAEALLEEERGRRDDLLAALEISEVQERPPPPAALRALRPIELRPASEPGPRLARARTEGEIEARALYGDDGSVVAVYYFGARGAEPLLREDDTSGDGKPDRWVGYQDGVRRDLYESRGEAPGPDIHVRFASDGSAIESIDVDLDADGRSERVFRYTDGRLVSEARDTDGDGTLDRFETFDADGRVALREEDLNADGRVDVRSTYQKGKLVSREIEDPAVVESLAGPR